MEYRNLGGTGLQVSRFCLGTMTLGTSHWKPWILDADKAFPILRKALDLGITFFDMADWYSTGANEEVVAGTLIGMVPRDTLVLATKAYYPMSADPNDKGLSRKHLMASIDRSLKRMGTDYVDLFIIHAFDPATPPEETMEALHDMRRAGKVLYLGASTMYAWQFAKMNAVAERHGWSRFINMQCQYSLLYREEEREMMPYCRDERIAVTTFSPLARGFLTGQRSVRAETDRFVDDFFGDAIDHEIAARTVQVATVRGVTPATVAMAWVLANPTVTCPLIGADAPEQVEAAVAAADFVLSPEERRFLEEPYRPRDVINDHNPVRRPRALYEVPTPPVQVVA